MLKPPKSIVIRSLILAIAIVALLAFWGRERILSVSRNNAPLTPEVIKEEAHGSHHKEYEEPESHSHDGEDDVTGNTYTIEIGNNSISHKIAKIKVNDVVGFRNTDEKPYFVVSEDKEFPFSTDDLEQGEVQYVIKYTKAGSYNYYLKNSPSVRGTIIVE